MLNVKSQSFQDEESDKIRGSETPEQHAATVWSELVTRCQAERIIIIAHSYGGVVTLSLASHPGLGPEVRSRVTSVLFTDSVHYGAAKWLGSVARNYVTSDEVSCAANSVANHLLLSI